VQDRLADLILAGEARPEMTLVLDAAADGLVLSPARVAATG